MRFKIKDIGEEGLKVDLPVTAEWLAVECPDLEARPGLAGVVMRGSLEKSGEDFLLRGDLRGVLESVCSRCIEQARVALDVPIAVTFVEKDGDGGDEDDDDDGDVVYFDGGEIDLGSELRDEILLAMPLSPLCQEGCRGLCAICGGNRNTTPCACEENQRRATTKLSALAKIKL